MAARLSFSQYRLEAEIERYRAGCQWDKIPALVEQLVSTRIHENDDYGDLLLAESLLEECLLENMALLRSSTPLMDDSLPKLATAKSHLNKILNRGRLEPRYLNEALLLMAKVHYAQGRYRDAQGMCAKAVIDHLTQDEQPVYHLRLLAEAFVIKGLSLDRQALSSASRVRLSEREDECLSCYLRACDAALLYLQELDKLMVVGQPGKGTKYHISSGYLEFDLSFFQQAALQSAYLSLLHKGHLAKGTQQLRRVLRTVDSRSSQSFRKAAARRLAEVLLSSISEDAYWDPLSPPPEDWLQREGPISSKEALLPTSRLPEYYSKDGSVFCPRDVVEEAVLLLLTTESMASGDAVISLTTDQKGAQEASLQDATSLYDMLTIGLARRGQYALLSQRLEGAMKFSFNEFHLCYQLGLSFMASGKAASAVSVLKECTQMQPDDPTLPLLAAKICINQLRWLEQGEALAQSVVAMGDEAGDFLPRAHLAIGLCYSLRATEATLKVTQDDFNRRALESLQRAHLLDPDDPQIALYLALQLALVRQVTAAMVPLEMVLSLWPDNLSCLHLLVLVLSAQKQYQPAMETLTVALTQHPDNFSLLFTKVKLEEVLLGPEAALRTCEDMLQLWQSRYEGVRSGDAEEGSNDSDPVTLSRMPSGTHLTLPDFQDVETGSQSAASVAASRLEQAWSEVSGNSSSHRQGPAHIWLTLERIWLQAGELFMAERREKEAQFCAQEASAVSPASHAVLLLRGRLAELRGCDGEAKTLYDEALTIHPQGHRILMHLGQLLMRTGRRGLGEKMLRDAVQAQSTAHEAWSCLGEALQRQGSAQAADCFLTALELEASCPIRPFSIIAREL
ncbi:tetratricopeptide repeat protein 7A isoform X1 [Brienomyrus brachyistius]|uniref:tetratricopeptide repeat protein 7A isoform X1 n=2 Tax=Brienomyrus brachyistius TaxID=42636 RepID=UPI0020B25A15|nr:tetratricopeptide repeat protein 7A isoform X1 [Brienomyrus brachyistius]